MPLAALFDASSDRQRRLAEEHEPGPSERET
jgi:hypothetical protein